MLHNLVAVNVFWRLDDSQAVAAPPVDINTGEEGGIKTTHVSCERILSAHNDKVAPCCSSPAAAAARTEYHTSTVSRQLRVLSNQATTQPPDQTHRGCAHSSSSPQPSTALRVPSARRWWRATTLDMPSSFNMLFVCLCVLRRWWGRVSTQGGCSTRHVAVAQPQRATTNALCGFCGPSSRASLSAPAPFLYCCELREQQPDSQSSD